MDLTKEKQELERLGYRIKSETVRHIYNKGEVIGWKIFIEVEKKVMKDDGRNEG